MASTSPVSPYKFLTESEMRGIMKDPACTWRWAVVLPDISGTIAQTTSTENGGAVQSPGSEVGVKTPIGLAMTLELAPTDMGIETRYGGGTAISVPRHDFTGNMAVTFYETYDYTMTRYLVAWNRMIVDADKKGINNFGLPSEYKKDLTFLAFDVNSNNRSLIQVTQTECFPTFPGGLSYGSDNGIITVSTEFTVDGSTYTFSDSPKEASRRRGTTTTYPRAKKPKSSISADQIISKEFYQQFGQLNRGQQGPLVGQVQR